MSLINATPAPAQAEEVSTAEVSQENLSQSAEWYIDEGIPGPGPRPEWLEPKFKHMKAVTQSLKELERKLGSYSTPESYDFSSFGDDLNVESPIIAQLTNKAKAHKLSQESFNDIVGEMVNYHKSLMPNMDEEIAKLGDNPKHRLNVVDNWVSNNLSPKAAETLGRIAYTADVVEMIDEIRNKFVSLSSKVPVGQEALPVAKVITKEEVLAEMRDNHKRYYEDEYYRNEISRKLGQAMGEG